MEPYIQQEKTIANYLNDPHIREIREEYRKIDHDWLLFHYKIAAGLVLFALVIECLMSVFVVHSSLLSTTVGRYILKFIVVPSGLNLLCLALDTMVIRAKQISQDRKIYTVSLVFVAICFTLSAAHNAFTAIYYIFTLAILLTAIYASFRLTCVTALSCLAALVISALFVRWDLDKISVFESTHRLVDFLITLFIMLACSAACLVEIRYEQKKNEASIQKEIHRYRLLQKLQTDELTGVSSRKALHDALRDMETNESGDPYIFAIADIDNFKSVNDSYGHHAGDGYLIKFAKLIKENSGGSAVFRYGGDEFCLLFSNANIDDAVEFCRQIQTKLGDLSLEEDPRLRLTASFGLAAYSRRINAAHLFIRADQALYQAKEERNAIRVFR